MWALELSLLPLLRVGEVRQTPFSMFCCFSFLVLPWISSFSELHLTHSSLPIFLDSLRSEDSSFFIFSEHESSRARRDVSRPFWVFPGLCGPSSCFLLSIFAASSHFSFFLLFFFHLRSPCFLYLSKQLYLSCLSTGACFASVLSQS